MTSSDSTRRSGATASKSRKSKRRVSLSPTAKRRRAQRAANARETKRQRNAEAIATGRAQGVKPVFWRYLRAVADVIDSGQPVTVDAISKLLGIGRVSLWRLCRRHPTMDLWVSDRLAERSARFMPRLEAKAIDMGLRGSVKHMAIALKFEELRVTRQTGLVAPGGTMLTFLVPRPELPRELPAGGYVVSQEAHSASIGGRRLDLDDAIPALEPEAR